MIEHSRGLSFIAYDQAQDGERFHVPFEYLAREHVRAFVGNRTVAVEWIDSTTVEIADQAGLISPPYPVTLRRFTPIDDLFVKHRDGARLPARDLKQGFQQLLFAHQERLEYGEGGVGGLPGGPPGTGGGGAIDDINTIIDEIMRSLAMQELLKEIELIGINAETIIENILRDMELAGITRDHGDKISQVESGLTLLTEHNQVIAQQFVELFARMDTADASMQTQFQQINQAIADEVSARVEALTSLHAQIVEEGEVTKLAINARIDQAEVNAESALASTRETLITQFTNADAELNTALIDKISVVETTAEEARVEQKNLILAQVNDSIGVVQQQVNTKVNEQQAQSIASTQLEAFKDTQFAALQQQFNVVVGEHDSMYGSWQASYSLKINAGTIGDKPVIAGIALSATQTGGSDFIIMADRMAIVSPYYAPGNNTTQLKYPFVVGTVGGVSTVGITGQLLVDGSITADKITTNTLSAITANAGTINGGTFKTHTLNSQGQVTNPTEFRVEMSNIGNWPLWMGSGAKSTNNAVFWIDRQGNAMFKGKINASNIIGAIQQHVPINWTGLAQTFHNTDGKNAGIGYVPTLVEFTLPAPAAVGESHIPYIHIMLEMQQLTAVVGVFIEVWEGGSWFPVAVREGPYVHTAWSGSDTTRPVMEQYIPISAVHIPVYGARTFRIRATSAYARAYQSNTGLSAYVKRVKGFAVGLR